MVVSCTHISTMLALPPPPLPPRGPLVGGKSGITHSPRSDRNNGLVPPLPAAAEAGSILTGLAGAEAGAQPSSPIEVHIIALHPNNQIATAVMEDEGGGLSATMVTADNDGRRGNRRPTHHCWRLEVVLPSSALPRSRDNSGLRGAQKPFARCAYAVADAVAPARRTAAGAAEFRGRKTKTGLR